MWSKTYGGDRNFDQFAPNRGDPLHQTSASLPHAIAQKTQPDKPPTDLGNTRLDSQKSTAQEPSAGLDWLDFRGLLNPEKIIELFDRLLTGLRSVRGGIYTYELSEGAAIATRSTKCTYLDTKKVGITNAQKDRQI